MAVKADGGESSCAGDAPPTRTPQVLLKDDSVSYCSKMQDLVLYISRHQFPTSCPSNLDPVMAAPGETSGVSQQKCTCGSVLFAFGDQGAKLIIEVGGRKLFRVNTKQAACASKVVLAL